MINGNRGFYLIKYKKLVIILATPYLNQAQDKQLAPTPQMGFMTWNYFADEFTEYLCKIYCQCDDRKRSSKACL